MSDVIVRAAPTAAETAIIEAGLRVAWEVAKTASEVVRLRVETQAFLMRADELLALVQQDVDAVAAQVGPLLTLLLTLSDLTVDDRRAILDAVRALSEAGARARADAIRELARKV